VIALTEKSGRITRYFLKPLGLLYVGFLMGALADGASIRIFEYAIGADERHQAQLGRKYESYRTCIRLADCRMDPDDFIEYYELKHKLAQEN